mmetsp:Transcript_35300/g.117986  ORF Transcript_35300/g.117986 Transcript_35300/m.117986 type:complete len:212 (+) Transcript_35300:285-920(+)
MARPAPAPRLGCLLPCHERDGRQPGVPAAEQDAHAPCVQVHVRAGAPRAPALAHVPGGPARGPEQRLLRRRTVLLQHGARAVAARAKLDIVQSSDNASCFKMVAPGLGVTERVMLCSWTALGEWHMHSAGGLDAAGRERSRAEGRYLVTGGAYATTVFPKRSVGAISCTHLDLRLPETRRCLPRSSPLTAPWRTLRSSRRSPSTRRRRPRC